MSYHPSAKHVAVVASAILVAFIILNYFLAPHAGYALSAQAKTLLPTAQPQFASKLKDGGKTFEYNQGYSPSADVKGDTSSPRFTASFSKNPSNGFSTIDPTTNVTFTIKPKFSVGAPQTTDNRVVYPVTGHDTQIVYTVQVAQIKEDMIINKPQGDSMQVDYQLVLPNGTEARMEQNGAVGIYSVDKALLGNVSTASPQDAQAFSNALKNGAKNTLLFTLPAPFVKEYGKQTTAGKAWYSLAGTTLTVHAQGLAKLTYPISIDPTVYIDTAAQFMTGNNESNIDFDISNGLIEKGKTTGGRFDNWLTSSLPLPSARWNQASVAAGGYAYVVGGSDGTNTSGSLYWSQFNASTGDLTAPTPGDGSACSSWCTNSAYDLPSGAVRQGSQLVAYSGYLYLIGGSDSTGTRTSTVYIAKIGANGEPQLWHPSDSNKANWVYWYQDTSLAAANTSFGALAYNNRLYIVGGSTSGSPNGDTVVRKADITPTGVLTNWTTVTALPTGLQGIGVQAYNNRLYVIGGASGTTTQNTVYYTKINSDGTLNSWLSTTPISNGNTGGTRASLGGTFTTVWGGYIYVAGGCTTLATNYCSAIANDIQLASINADGSITNWTTILNVNNTDTNYNLLSWRNNLYMVGGCAAQNSSGVCTSPQSAVLYGSINPDGDASTVNTSSPSGTAPCSGTNPTNCDMPPAGKNAGQGGQMTGATIINNGYIYYLGGCTYVANGSVCYTGNSGKASTAISYAAIASDGSIVRATATCTGGTLVGSWCVMANGLPSSLAAFGYAVYNNAMYIVGGTDGTTWQSNIYSSKFNSDGTWGTWTTQAFSAIGISAAAIGYPYVFTRANPSSAATDPGNLYIIGGCYGNQTDPTITGTGLDCSGTFLSSVYKCNITTTGTIDTTNKCSTTNQLQIDAEPNTSGSQGIGTMAGTVYANYIYLIGGQSPNELMRGEVMYAKIDNNNNIVATDGTTTSPWTMSPYQLNPIRRRGVAFGYNGYIYALAGYNINSGGSLNDLLYAQVNVSDGSISDFRTSSVTVSPRWDLRAAVNNGYVYAMGGCSVGAPPASCTTMTGTVQTFQLYNNYSGSPKSYAAGNQYSTDRYGAGTTIMNGYIYLAGGCTTAATDCTTATNSVQYAPIQADGTIGTWASTTVIPAALTWGKLVNAGGTLYYVGGQAGGSNNGTSTVYYATMGSSGTISSWTAATNGLPAGRSQFGATVWNNRIYVVGGNDATGAVTNTVYVSPQLNSGGNITSTWDTASTTLPVARSGAAVVSYANNLYAFGGYNGTQYLNDTNYAQIDGTTGRSGSWNYGTSLPTTLRQADGFAANGFMYLFGGRSAATTCTSNTIVAPISANTTIASGNHPTGIGEWYATNIRYSGARYGAAVAYSDGKAFVLGGQCNGSIIGTTTTDRVQYGTVQSQPQIARYSRMIDTDSDVFPTKWLINGLDNSIGARWYLNYSSMTNPYAASGQQCAASPMTTWGQNTNYGQITLGTADTYTPLDGSGVNTNCARFFYFLLNIDSSQAYGYPEDVTRGPTITDFSLYFTSDPSKRLMHGRTFTGGLQMPDDTPF